MFNAHNAKMELVDMNNNGLITTEEMCNMWNIVDDAEQDLATAATDVRIDASAAEYDFRMFCADNFMSADKFLAGLAVAPEHSTRYWKRVLVLARLASAAYLAQ